MKKTEIIEICLENPDNKTIEKAAREIKKGKIIVYPTETCYGLGTNSLNKKAVGKIYAIKRRPMKADISVIVPDLKTAKKYGVIDDLAKRLVKKFMPGPLTLIVKRRASFPKTTNKDFVFRIPGSKLALKLARKSNTPLTATSANIHGLHSVYSSKEAIEQLDGKVDIILDAGKLKKTKPSTIIDLKSGTPRLIRKGPIKFTEIQKEWKKFKTKQL